MKIINILTGIICLSFITSCNEGDFLKSNPVDFYSSSSAYKTQSDFNEAVNKLYSQAREYTQFDEGEIPIWTTDIAFRSNMDKDSNINNPAATLVPSSDKVIYWWKRWYSLVFNSNIIISRINSESIDFEDSEKKLYEAEAKFFRAFGYRYLAGLFGGVPLVLKEALFPKKDYSRATRVEVWQQCVKDLIYSAKYLPGPDNVAAPGRLNKYAADELLAEIYLSLHQWGKAISVTDTIINSGKFQLMRNRFGTRDSEPGDVFWDLFRKGNQNRSTGNLESIWVFQYKAFVKGGPDGPRPNVLERRATPRYFALSGPEGTHLFIGPLDKYGRGQGFIQPTYYVSHDIWVDDKGDIRNSKYNILRDIKAQNPDSKYNGKYIIKNNLISAQDTIRNWFPFYTKFTTPNNHPAQLIENKKTGLLFNTAGGTFRDLYAMRLAETYLLRAEAYLHKGNKAKAAENINVVRERAHATPVKISEVNMDYLLDERVRELYLESPRVITLSRLGLNYKRKRKYNNWGGKNILPRHNLWPIPNSEIESNTEANLKQNPGY